MSTTSGIGESYTVLVVAIVTGASSGLGQAIAELLAPRMPLVGVSRHQRPSPRERGEGGAGGAG